MCMCVCESQSDSCVPDVTIELFGSSASGFAVITSNVNLNINIPGAQEKQVSLASLNVSMDEAMAVFAPMSCYLQLF